MNQLPDELKLEIFSFLDKKSLLCAASTCKQLRYLILTYKPLMAYLDFVVTDFGTQRDFIINYGIGLSTISLGTNDINNWRLPKVIKINSTDLQLLIRSVPKIEELKVNEFCPPVAAKKIVPDLNLPFLKKLTRNHKGNNIRMLNFLNECRPIEYKANFRSCRDSISYFSDTFWNWINLQSNLTSLTLCDFAMIEFFKQIKVDELQIKFKKLTMVCNYMGRLEMEEEYLANLLEFLEQQDEVSEMFIKNFFLLNSFKSFPKAFHRILFEMSSLTSLTVKECLFNSAFETSQFKDVNLNVKILILEIVCNSDIPKYCYHFPNVKSLEVKSVTYQNITQNLKSISQNMMDLEIIKLINFSLINSLELIRFNNLKIISLVECSVEVNDWRLLTQRTPLVENLSLHIYKLSNDSARMFINWRNLKELDLQCGLYQDGLINELIVCPALKHLKISESMRDQFADQLQNVDMKVEVVTMSKLSKYAKTYNLFVNRQRETNDFDSYKRDSFSM